MVDVTEKGVTTRVARASGSIKMQDSTLAKIRQGQIEKGDVLAVAQVAGIMAAKNTAATIPMCHPLALSSVDIRFDFESGAICCQSEVRCEAKTGVEMEALQAVSVALLTVYDMVKAIDKNMEMSAIRLDYKMGGKSGLFARGKVLSINRSDEKGTVKLPIQEGYFLPEHGLQDDAHSGKWHRQVSLLASESYQKMAQLGSEDLPLGSYAENLTTQGICLYELPIGTRLRIGQTLHRVTQIGKECHKGCAIKQTVGDCVMPREGIFTEVLEGGVVRVGDEILTVNE